jgi:hypothetical protein
MNKKTIRKMSYYGGYYGQSYEERALHFNIDPISIELLQTHMAVI